MSLRSRVKRIERQSKKGLPLEFPPSQPNNRRQRETDYQDMLQALARGERHRYRPGEICLIAMLTNRQPKDFERDVLKVCGPNILREICGESALIAQSENH